jgi:hypothetical protein
LSSMVNPLTLRIRCRISEAGTGSFDRYKQVQIRTIQQWLDGKNFPETRGWKDPTTWIVATCGRWTVSRATKNSSIQMKDCWGVMDVPIFFGGYPKSASSYQSIYNLSIA